MKANMTFSVSATLKIVLKHIKVGKETEVITDNARKYAILD